jgi:hypothetical protein
LVKYLYREIEKGNPEITETGAKNMLEEFVTVYHLVPMSFKRNDDARLKVYEILTKMKMQNKTSFWVKKS